MFGFKDRWIIAWILFPVQQLDVGAAHQTGVGLERSVLHAAQAVETVRKTLR